MTTRTKSSADHPAQLHDVYRRMLRAAGTNGQLVTLANGHRVHVIKGGDGPPVVHLHGNNTSSLSHLMLLEWTPSVRSYLVDRPGMGLSDPYDSHPERARHGAFRDVAIRFVDEVLDALGLDSAALVGASGGGVYATWYALACPQRVRGLVLLGSTPTLPGGRVPAPIRMMATPMVGAVMARIKPGRRMLLGMMASVGEATTVQRHSDLLDSLVWGARDPVAVAANRAELRALISPLGFRSPTRIQPDDLRRLAVPTLMIWGDRDPVVPVANARAAAAEIPDARLEVLPAGHVPQLGHPEHVGRLITAFVHSCTPSVE